MVYLDHAAATPTDPAVVKAMQPYFSEVFGNPSSFHAVGMRAKNVVAESRKHIAKCLNAHEDELIFTSGGTESDNLAVVGVVAHLTKCKSQSVNRKTQKQTQESDFTTCALHFANALPHVITSAIEHPAVLEPLMEMKKRGEIELTVVGVDRYGKISVKEVTAAIKPTTVLVSIMMANNEIGTIEPIAEIGRAIIKHRKAQSAIYPYFHTDACQAMGFLEIDVEKMHVDLLTLNGSKIYGPKGVGALYVRRGVKLQPLVLGGGQERNLRSGTENVSGIVGLAKALTLAQAHREKESARLVKLRERLSEGLLKIPKTILNGHPIERLPNSVNISFMDIEGEAAVLYLDAQGVMVSTGSACASASLDPSHVILATGLSYEAAHGSIRFTLGHATTKADIDRVIRIMPGIVERLRKMSPVELDMKHFKKG